MKYIILKSILAILGISTILMGSPPLITYADEVDQEKITDSMEPVIPVGPEIVESAYTSYSEETSAILSVMVVVPEEFEAGVYAQVKNLDTNTIYNLPLYRSNGYTDHCYVPEGNYSFLIVSAYEDSASSYSFDFPINQFYIEANGSAEYEIVLNNYEETEAVLNDKYAKPEEIEENKEEHVKSSYDVIHEGTGLGELGITGESDDEYELIFKITQSGGYTEAMYVYSSDLSNNWSEPAVIPLSGIVKFGNTGLELEFFLPEGASFVKDDTYSVYIPDPSKKITIKQEMNSKVEIEVQSNTDNMKAFDVLEAMATSIKIKIIKGGTIGKAVWQVSTDNGLSWTAEAYASEKLPITMNVDGVEYSVTLLFTPTSEKAVIEFEKDDVFKIYAENTAKDNTGTAITTVFVLLIGIGVAVVFGNKKLKDAIPSEQDYELRG